MTAVLGSLQKLPAEPFVIRFFVKREKVQNVEPERVSLLLNRGSEGRAKPLTTVSFLDIDSAQPRCEMGARVHVVRT